MSRLLQIRSPSPSASVVGVTRPGDCPITLQDTPKRPLGTVLSGDLCPWIQDWMERGETLADGSPRGQPPWGNINGSVRVVSLEELWVLSGLLDLNTLEVGR